LRLWLTSTSYCRVWTRPAHCPGSWPAARRVPGDRGGQRFTDGSARIARRLGATVVSAAPRGFGAAAHAGLVAATAGVVCFLDADGSFDPAQLPRVVGPVRAGHADLVLGRRRPDRHRCLAGARRLGNALLARRCAGAPGSRCRTWVRCAPRAARHCWTST